MNRAERRALGKAEKRTLRPVAGLVRPTPSDEHDERFSRDLEVCAALGVVIDYLRETGEAQGGKAEQDAALLAALLMPLWKEKRRATCLGPAPRMPWDEVDG